LSGSGRCPQRPRGSGAASRTGAWGQAPLPAIRIRHSDPKPWSEGERGNELSLKGRLLSGSGRCPQRPRGSGAASRTGAWGQAPLPAIRIRHPDPSPWSEGERGNQLSLEGRLLSGSGRCPQRPQGSGAASRTGAWGQAPLPAIRIRHSDPKPGALGAGSRCKTRPEVGFHLGEARAVNLETRATSPSHQAPRSPRRCVNCISSQIAAQLSSLSFLGIRRSEAVTKHCLAKEKKETKAEMH